jgi:hypothetical protein
VRKNGVQALYSTYFGDPADAMKNVSKAARMKSIWLDPQSERSFLAGINAHTPGSHGGTPEELA